jgi:uncharacterized protein DUF2752
MTTLPTRRGYYILAAVIGAIGPRSQWAPAHSDLARALLWSWLLLSALGTCAVVAAFALPEQLVLSAGRALQAPHDAPCVLCGMTRALVALGQGQLTQALAFNRGAIVLVPTVFVSCLSATALLIHRVRRTGLA